MNKVYLVGVGMTPFRKPGRDETDYPGMVREAGSAALAKARQVPQATVALQHNIVTMYTKA